MAEISARPQTQIEPATAWTVLTDAPLRGLALAREAGRVLAWDERDQVTLLGLRGEHCSVVRMPERIVAAAISDDGSLVALLGEGARLRLLGADLDEIADRQAPPESSTVVVDAHGRFVAVASRLGTTKFYGRNGRPAGGFETKQALASLCFVPGRPFLLGAADYGRLVGVELGPGTAPDRLGSEIAWEEALMSTVGRLTTTGDGGMVFASCFNHGVQRFDLRGHNEGAYQLGGTAAHAVPDFAGRMIAVATVEGELAVLSSGGNVRWRTSLPRPAIALEADPLGRFLIYGHDTGEIVRLDLYGGTRATAVTPAPEPPAARAGAGSVRKPAWTASVVASEEQAESAVLTVLDDPPRIGLLTNSNQLQVFTTRGELLGLAPEVLGVGRFLRTVPGWIAAATDRQMAVFDARRNAVRRIDLSLVEVTHLAIRPDTFGLAVVQERDRIGRATLAGRWVWTHELKHPVEDAAIGPDGFAAATTTDGRLTIYDPSGVAIESPMGPLADDLYLIDAPDPAPAGVTWLTLARRAQILRGHDLKGKVLWETPVPWEGWQLLRLGELAIVTAPDGRALAFDGSGRLRAEGRSATGPTDVFGPGDPGQPLRISRQGVHLICAELGGRVRWRAVADEALGPLAVGRAGVAALIGRSLAWFPHADPSS